MAPKKKAHWSKMIDQDGISIRLYARPGGTTVYMSFMWEGTKLQRSTKRRDRPVVQVQIGAVEGHALGAKRHGEAVELGVRCAVRLECGDFHDAPKVRREQAIDAVELEAAGRGGKREDAEDRSPIGIKAIDPSKS